MDKTDNVALRLNRTLEKQSEHLVEMAEKALPEARMNNLRGILRLGQFNNLLGVALETDSPRVVQNWLLYQMGRNERNVRPWRESGLGDLIVKEIQSGAAEDLQATAKRIAAQVYGADKATLEQIQDVHINLVRRYIGYLKRWFVAKGGQA